MIKISYKKEFEFASSTWINKQMVMKTNLDY